MDATSGPFGLERAETLMDTLEPSPVPHSLAKKRVRISGAVAHDMQTR
jgi:hypothetical protein